MHETETLERSSKDSGSWGKYQGDAADSSHSFYSGEIGRESGRDFGGGVQSEVSHFTPFQNQNNKAVC
jgi:hypothetical protein